MYYTYSVQKYINQTKIKDYKENLKDTHVKENLIVIMTGTIFLVEKQNKMESAAEFSFFFVFLPFLGLLLQHMEVPRQGA